jgi:hypothetical protein
MNNTITKIIQKRDEFFVTFTDEEMKDLNISPGDKFSIKQDENGILLERYGSIEIDISQFSRETLEALIVKSVEEDISINDVISEIFEKVIKENKE